MKLNLQNIIILIINLVFVFLCCRNASKLQCTGYLDPVAIIKKWVRRIRRDYFHKIQIYLNSFDFILFIYYTNIFYLLTLARTVAVVASFGDPKNRGFDLLQYAITGPVVSKERLYIMLSDIQIYT